MKFLFDLGGVFFDWNPKYFYKSIFPSEKEMEFFLKNICNQEWNIKQDAGRSIKDGEKELIVQFPKYTKEIQMYYPNHHKMIKGTFQNSIDQLLELKFHNYLCYVLSNWSAETFIGVKDDYSFLNKFDGLLISGENKLVKPDKAIYKLAISRFDLIPDKTVFIDDKIENIEAAKELNFKTIHIIDPKNIKEQINNFI